MRFEKPDGLINEFKFKIGKIFKWFDIKFNRFWVDAKWHIKENYEVYVVLGLIFISGFCLGIIFKS